MGLIFDVGVEMDGDVEADVSQGEKVEELYAM